MKQIMKVTYIAIIASALLVTGIAPIGITYADKSTAGTGTIDPEWDPRGDDEQRGKSCVSTRHDTGTVEFKEDLTNTGIVGNGYIDTFYSINRCTDVIRYTLKSIYTFDEVTIAGVEGGAVLILEAHGIVDRRVDPRPTHQGNLRLVSSTGNLEGLHLAGEAQLTPAYFPDGNYEIRTHIDP